MVTMSLFRKEKPAKKSIFYRLGQAAGAISHYGGKAAKLAAPKVKSGASKLYSGFQSAAANYQANVAAGRTPHSMIGYRTPTRKTKHRKSKKKAVRKTRRR